MTVDPTGDEQPRPESETHRLLKRIDAGITLLVVTVLLVAAFFVYRHFEDQHRKDADRYVSCIVAGGDSSTC